MLDGIRFEHHLCHPETLGFLLETAFLYKNQRVNAIDCPGKLRYNCAMLKNVRRNAYSFVDLFAGAGGFTEGFLLAGDERNEFSLVGASDIHEGAGNTHFNRFSKTLGIDYEFLTKDVRDSDFLSEFISGIERSCGRPNVDVVVGGPPCQGFSVFGKREESDPRNDLFRYYLQAIEALRPKYFVMENVPGLALMYGGKVIDEIHKQVRAMSPTSYEIVGPIYVNAADFGVPQSRQRVLFIGSRADVPKIESLQAERTRRHVTVSESIDDLAFLNPWEKANTYSQDDAPLTKYQRESRQGRLFKKFGIRAKGVLTGHEAAKHTPDVIARFAMIRPGQGFDSIPGELWTKHLQSNKKWCIRLHPNKPSNTVVTLPDDFVHHSKPRIPTAREMARLQSFDDTFDFLGPRSTGGGGKGNKKRAKDLPQYTQIGNAVPPLMAAGIAKTILAALLET
jgi:DNA (cytosine-5)-methyltransferase 1